MGFADAWSHFARGAGAGFVVCIPPGPMGALCVSHSVRHGFHAAWALTFGAAVGDAVYAALAAFGVGAVGGSLGPWTRIAALVATPLLVWMGARTLKKARATSPAAIDLAAPEEAPEWTAAFAMGVVMSLGTPGTLPAFIALFAATAPRDGAADFVGPASATVGALVGALVWWASVAAVCVRFRTSVARHVRWIDMAGGVLLLVAAVVAAGYAVSR